LERLPSEIALLKNLAQLYLNQNRFKEFPKEVRGLKHLEQLDIKNNAVPIPMNPQENMNFGFRINF
jgi:Leucine-rich repeat (LRR) protein